MTMKRDAKKWVRHSAERFLRRAGVRAKQIVLDFGCNEGNYAKAAARIVGPAGKIYALDEDRKALGKLKREAGKRNLGNIECLHVSKDDNIPLPSLSVDVVLLYDVLHRGYLPEWEERERVLKEVHRILKPRGLLSLYPTHLKQYGMTFRRQIREVKGSGFRLRGESRRRLVHDGTLVRGRVFTFRKEHRGRGNVRRRAGRAVKGL